MNIFAIKGHKVKCVTLNAGYDYHKEIAEKHLEVGEEYIIERTDVDSYHTDVYLKEIPGVKFNSVFFSDISPQSKEDDKKHHQYYRFRK